MELAWPKLLNKSSIPEQVFFKGAFNLLFSSENINMMIHAVLHH